MVHQLSCSSCGQLVDFNANFCPHCGQGHIDDRSSSVESRVLELTNRGELIQAIKIFREATGLGLADAKRRVEEIARQGPAEANPTNFDQEILHVLRAQGKIAAIRCDRAKSGRGLKESKDYVEALAADHDVETSNSGCLGMVLAMILPLGWLIDRS